MIVPAKIAEITVEVQKFRSQKFRTSPRPGVSPLSLSPLLDRVENLKVSNFDGFWQL
jgi:hypothetical protein